MTYSLAAYGRMIADSRRIHAYSEALRRTVSEGSVVLDIGTGTGIFAILACRFGAKRVYALEPSAIIEIGREIACANGFSDRIEFIQESSDRVELPEKVDLIISDLRDTLPYFRHHLPSLADARQRFLKPGGVMIPIVDRVYAAVVEAPKIYENQLEGWAPIGPGLDLSCVKKRALNQFSKVRAKPDQLMVEPHEWAVVDYLNVNDWNSARVLGWKIKRSGTGHGVVVWFDTILCEGVGFSNSPSAEEMVYGSAFFPWLKPVELQIGDRVKVFLEARLVGDDYLWRWDTTVFESRQKDVVKAEFKQSTFHAWPVRPASLLKQTGRYVPRLNEEGELDQFVLSLMDGKRDIDEIAGILMNRFPNRFRSMDAALKWVGRLSEKYSY